MVKNQLKVTKKLQILQGKVMDVTSCYYLVKI